MSSLTLPPLSERRGRPPSPPPTEEAINTAWNKMPPAEQAYMRELEKEVYAAVIKTIEDNNRNKVNNIVVVFLRRTLSDSALFVLKAQGYKVRLQIERRFENGKVIELLKPAVILD